VTYSCVVRFSPRRSTEIPRHIEQNWLVRTIWSAGKGGRAVTSNVTQICANKELLKLLIATTEMTHVDNCPLPPSIYLSIDINTVVTIIIY
jgi:hypothetical protein